MLLFLIHLLTPSLRTFGQIIPLHTKQLLILVMFPIVSITMLSRALSQTPGINFRLNGEVALRSWTQHIQIHFLIRHDPVTSYYIRISYIVFSSLVNQRSLFSYPFDILSSSSHA